LSENITIVPLVHGYINALVQVQGVKEVLKYNSSIVKILKSIAFQEFLKTLDSKGRKIK
jgi:hypothetical protein